MTLGLLEASALSSSNICLSLFLTPSSLILKSSPAEIDPEETPSIKSLKEIPEAFVFFSTLTPPLIAPLLNAVKTFCVCSRHRRLTVRMITLMYISLVVVYNLFLMLINFDVS